MTLARLETRFNHLYRDCLIARIDQLAALLDRQAPSIDEIEINLRDLLPEERETVLTIYVNLEARKS